MSSVDKLSSMTAQVTSQMRRNAVTQIATQMEKLKTAGTVDVLQQSLQAMTISKPQPGSVSSILNVLA
ncbi:MAG: hypothetical protein MUF11_05635 [Beijerinckiaceae bacterium]|jgi:hypothetical protein|nr:hypothetical protein [Beijerinckiaceae bacterium]